MILCDLPYGTTRNKWDSIIPLEPLWKEYRRVAKPSAAIVLTASGSFTMVLGASNLGEYKYKWIWEKSNATNFLNAKKQPLRKHEDILVFYRKPTTYNPQKTQGKPYLAPQGSIGECYNPARPGYTSSSLDGSRYPVDVVSFNVGRSETDNIGLHPTQKPVALGRYLIRTYTNPGDLVLDNACGSGSFLLAAKEEGRQWLGMEQDPGYLSMARDRLAAA